MARTLAFVFAALAWGGPFPIPVGQGLQSGVAFLEVQEKPSDVARLAQRCGSEIDWARGWKDASERAASENKLVMVLVEEFRGAGIAIKKQALAGPLMDSDVVELLRERFVGLQWSDRMDAPFNRPAVYGLGKSTFGAGVLFVSPDGRVVGDSPSTNPFYLYSFACDVLARHPEFSGKAMGELKDELTRAEAQLHRGELEEARKLLQRSESARSLRLQGTLLRRLRQGHEALRVLERARAAGDKGMEFDLDLEEAVLHLRLKHFKEAEGILQRLVARRVDHPRMAEARYWTIAVRYVQLGASAIQQEAENLIASHPDSRWAWRAAAILCDQGLASGYDRLDWPSEKLMKVAARLDSAIVPDSNAGRAEREAVDYLLKTQLKDGSWGSALLLDDLGAENTRIAVAVTSICGEGLLAYRDREEVAAALGRALEFTLKPRELRVLTTKRHPAAGFDMTMWGQAFALKFMTACLEEKVGERQALLSAIRGLVRELDAAQGRNGGWSYFHGVSGQDGFTTSVVLLALLAAKRAGIEVPPAMITRGADSVAALRCEDGSFSYCPEFKEHAAAEASLRGPLYALALQAAGKGDVAEIRKTLALYLKHRLKVRGERGKALCHTGPEGTASYYLLFGYVFAAEALHKLPPEEWSRYREALLEDVLNCRTEEGAFCDNPYLGGNCYGAGMAVRTLFLLRKES